jgi:hypothetical protein
LSSCCLFLLLLVVLAGIGVGRSFSGTWSSHLNTTVDWAFYVFGFTLHHPVVACVDV